MAALRTLNGFRLEGTALRRLSGGLHKLDLFDSNAARAFFLEMAPDIIIHSAAERHPDVCQNDPDATVRLNVGATRVVAECAAELDAWLVYMSTDYVFDGTNPPYFPDSIPNPLNLYGTSKRDGEVAVREAGGKSAVLRVPILYGPVEDLDESPITIIAKSLMSGPEGEVVLDHWATRYPTFSEDVAAVLKQMVQRRDDGTELLGTFHWSGSEPMTKFDMGIAIAEVLDRPTENIVANPDPPPGAPRPHNCQLDCSSLEELSIGQRTPFRQGIEQVLRPYIDR
jgi:dTDP-4-dehydrorhamnose reductase